MFCLYLDGCLQLGSSFYLFILFFKYFCTVTLLTFVVFFGQVNGSDGMYKYEEIILERVSSTSLFLMSA